MARVWRRGELGRGKDRRRGARRRLGTKHMSKNGSIRPLFPCAQKALLRLPVPTNVQLGRGTQNWPSLSASFCFLPEHAKIREF